MSLTEGLSHRQAATGRITDVFQRLEQSKPLAVRLAGETTAGQTYYSNDQSSTWGFNPLGQVQRPAHMKAGFADYVILLVTECTKRRYLRVPEDTAKEAAIGNIGLYPSQKLQSKWYCTSYFEGFLANYDLHTFWHRQVKNVSTEPPMQRRSEPVVAVNLSDYLDSPTLDWDESDCKAAEAVLTFSEELNADH